MSRPSQYFYYPDIPHSTSAEQLVVSDVPEDYVFLPTLSAQERAHQVYIHGGYNDSNDLDNLVFGPMFPRKRRREELESDVPVHHQPACKKARAIVNFDINDVMERGLARSLMDTGAHEEAPHLAHQQRQEGCFVEEEILEQSGNESDASVEVVEKKNWKGKAREVPQHLEEAVVPGETNYVKEEKGSKKKLKGKRKMKEMSRKSTPAQKNCLKEDLNIIGSLDEFTGPKDGWVAHAFHSGFWEAPRTPTEDDVSTTAIEGPLVRGSEENFFSTKKLNGNRTRRILDESTPKLALTFGNPRDVEPSVARSCIGTPLRFLVPHPPTLFPPSEKQAFSGSTNSFSSSSSSSASANYFDRLSRASMASAYMTDITPPITPTNSNFDVELKEGSVASSGPFPDERSLQEHLAAEHFSNSHLRPIAALEDDGGYRSDSEEDSGAFDAVANFRSRLLKSKESTNSRRALRIIESRSDPDADFDGRDDDHVEVPLAETNVTSQIETAEEEFALPDDWENIFDRGMDAIWQEFKESVYGFNPEEPQPKNLLITTANKSKSEVRSHEFPIFDLDSDVGHQLGQDNIPRGMVFERLPPTPKLPAKPIIRPVDPDWDVSSLCLDTPSVESSSSISMSIISPVRAQHATDVIPSSPAICNESSFSLCDSPSFESSASISMSLLSPVQNDTNVIMSSPAIFNESFAHGHIPLMSPPAAVSRSMFAARRERRSFPVALTGENLDIAAIMRLEIAASNYGIHHHHHHRYEPHPVPGLPGPHTQPQHHIPSSNFVSYPSFYDHSFDDTMPESMSHRQFMVIASSFAQESTPAQQQEHDHDHGLDLKYDLFSRPGDFLQVREVPKSPLPSNPSQPLVGLGLGALTEGALRSSASISRLEDEPDAVERDAQMPAVYVSHDEHSSPRVDVTASQCTAEIEPSGVLSRLQSVQSHISMSIRARRDHRKGITGPHVDNDVHHHPASDHGQPSSPVDKAYMADDESEIEPSGVLSNSQPVSRDRTDLRSLANHGLMEPSVYSSHSSITNVLEGGEDPGETHGILRGSQPSAERPLADTASSSRRNFFRSSKRISRLFRSSPVLATTVLVPESISQADVPRSSLTHTSDLTPTTVDTDTVGAPSVISTIVAPHHPSDSMHATSDSATRLFASDIAPQDTSSDLLLTAPQTSGHGPEHPTFLSRISPLYHLAQSLRSDEYLARSRANLALPAFSSSYALQDLNISHLGLSSFVLTPGNDPRSPCSPSVEYFYPESYILGCQEVLPPSDNISPDSVAQIPPSSSTSRVSALLPSSSGLLRESGSMEGLGIGLPSELLVASQSTMSTAEESQNLAQLASAPSPNAEDFGSSTSSGDNGIPFPQSAGSPTTPRLFFKVPKFAKRRLYDIPEQPTPSPTLSAHRLRFRAPAPHAQQQPRQPSRSAKWTGLSVLKRLCSSTRLSWVPFSANRKEPSSLQSAPASGAGDGDGSNEGRHIGPMSPVDDNDNGHSCPPAPRDDAPILPAAKSAGILRRCFNKITRSTVSASFLSSSPPPLPTFTASGLSPGIIEHHDIAQPSSGVFKSMGEEGMAPLSRKFQVLF
ncbi:hypothetical protein CVT25_007005 [Psilocybe cyanescens]|uniref:Uncharacterized protein n=1 Tax=Psilocybe cyanescens TaxID=93625 RepID=A0A409WYC5_PSICY|nr:hypothetical protein CVT25_007005 [Psilocybe cyanescens]